MTSTLSPPVRCGKTLWDSWPCLEAAVMRTHLPRSHSHKLHRYYCYWKQNTVQCAPYFSPPMCLKENAFCWEFFSAHITHSLKRPPENVIDNEPPQSMSRSSKNFMCIFYQTQVTEPYTPHTQCLPWVYVWINPMLCPSLWLQSASYYLPIQTFPGISYQVILQIKFMKCTTGLCLNIGNIDL